MRGFLHSVGSQFSLLWHQREGLSLANVRSARLHYALAYAFELILYALVRDFVTPGVTLFGLSSWTFMYVGHMLVSLVVMLLWSNRFKHFIYVSLSAMAVGLAGSLILSDGYLRLAFAIIACAGLGGAVTAARCGYAFAANNAERVVGMIVTVFPAAVVTALHSLNTTGILVTHIFPIVIFGAMALCLLKFKERDFDVKEESSTSDERGLYWALAYMIAYFAIDGYISGLTYIGQQSNSVLYPVGRAISGLVFVAVLVLLRQSVWHIWNLFFLFAILTAVFAIFAPQFGTAAPYYFLGGLANLGWPVSLYMLACAQRRFASYRLLKKCTVIFVILSPITTVSDEVVESFFPQYLPYATLVYVLVIVTGFLMTSPHSYKYLFSAIWLSDLHKSDMQILREKINEADRFEKYNLTRREKEIAVRMLAANTSRMIAAELSIKESTVNFHVANLYKKLGINSRAELFSLFGVSEQPEEKREPSMP